MMNYIKSERYRLARKKSLHITSLVACSLIVAFALVLDFFGRNEVGFPYATSYFFYANVVNGALFIFIIILIVNLSLTGKDQRLLKQSISFGVSRQTIFWSKLFVTFVYFLLLCLVGMLLMVGFGESLFPKDGQAMPNFLIASANMIPIVISGFFLVHALKMSRIGDVYVIIIIIFFYTMSDSIIHVLFRRFELLSDLYKWAPSALLNDNMLAYAEYTVSFEWSYWGVGIGLSVVFLFFGAWNFNRKDID